MAGVVFAYSDQELAVIFTFIEAMHQMNRGTVAHYRKDDTHKQTEV